MNIFLKGLIATCLLFICLAAQAEHHRGHALSHIFVAEYELLQFKKYNERFESRTVLAPGNDRFLNLGDANLMRNIRRQLDEIKDILIWGGDLDDARRLMNQPWDQKDQQRVGPASVLYRMYRLTYGQSQLIGRSSADPRNAQKMINSLGKAWRSADLALWHINDAIREET